MEKAAVYGLSKTQFNMNKPQSGDEWYWELFATCRTDLFDLISFYLFELGASGIEEISNKNNEVNLRVFFPSSIPYPRQLLQALEQLDDLKGEEIVIRSLEKRPVENWQEGWQAFFKPVEIGEVFSIRPPWETVHPKRKEIVIYPGQGFGTGYHESTHLALLLLEWLLKSRQNLSVTDVGTGSGILTIAASLMNSGRVTAIDLDRDALLEVPKNLIHSGLDTMDVTLIQSGPEALKSRTDLVIANIEGHILERLADDLKRLVRPEGYLLLSGILTEYEVSLMKVFLDTFDPIKMLRMGEWSGAVLQKK